MTPEDRLARLRREGADRHDPLGARLVASLLERAAAAGGGAGARLAARAEERLAALEARIARGRAEAEARLAALAAAGEPVDAALAEALASGDFAAVAQGVRRRLRERERDRQRVVVPALARLLREAEARGLDLPEIGGLGVIDAEAGVVARGARRRALALVHAIATALFRESAERARAALLVARATDNMPEAAGPYNAQVLSARALAELAALSPRYLRALIAELDDLGGLKAALETMPGRARKAARRRERLSAR